MTSIRTRSFVVASAAFAAFTGLALTAPAQANVGDIRVVYGDLDLSTAQGHRTLQRRVSAASRKVCDFADDANHMAFERCRAYVRDDARKQLDKAGVPVAL